MRNLALILLIAVTWGCSTANIFKGQESYNREHYASTLKKSIDSAIAREIKKESPNGYLTKPYSREIWDEYWNSRIKHIYTLGTERTPKGYVGQNGPGFIKYIIESRAKAGLPPINLEASNVGKVPSA